MITELLKSLPLYKRNNVEECFVCPPYPNSRSDRGAAIVVITKSGGVFGGGRDFRYPPKKFRGQDPFVVGVCRDGRGGELFGGYFRRGKLLRGLRQHAWGVRARGVSFVSVSVY